LNCKNNEIYQILGGLEKTQKANLMGVTKHFVQEKLESKLVELMGTKSNDVELTTDPKHPISRLSKFERDGK
jgi:hypothetical protein